MLEITLIALFLSLLIVFSAFSLRRSRYGQAHWKNLLSTEEGMAAIEGLCREAESLVSQQALFHDEDYLWLLKMKAPEAARTLKKRRIRLSRHYLREMREMFRQLFALHAYLTASDEASVRRHDPVAAMAVTYEIKWLWAYWSIPLHYVHFHLSSLARTHAGFSSVLTALQRRLELITAT